MRSRVAVRCPSEDPIKHATYVIRGASPAPVRAGPAQRTEIDAAAIAAHEGSFALTDDETAAGALAEFDTAHAEYLAAVAATDPSSPTVEPPAPWHGIDDSAAGVRPLLPRASGRGARPPRRSRRHHPRAARRVAVPAIVLSESGFAANDFFQPYVAARAPSGTADG